MRFNIFYIIRSFVIFRRSRVEPFLRISYLSALTRYIFSAESRRMKVNRIGNGSLTADMLFIFGIVVLNG